MQSRIVAFSLLASGLFLAGARAQERPTLPASGVDPAEIKKKIVKSVFDSATLGTEIFNKGNFEGCFRLYQGTLLAVQPHLETKLGQSVKDKMDRAKSMSFPDGAHELRKALDEIQNEIAPSKTDSTKMEPKADAKNDKSEAKTKLWDRLGGAGGVSKLADNCHNLAIEDSKLKRFFTAPKPEESKIKELKLNLVEYISSVSGGPLPFKGKDIKGTFAGLKVTDAEFDAFKSIFEAQLNKIKDLSQTDIKDLDASIEALRKDIVEAKSKN